MADLIPFPILIPRHLGDVHWTATICCADDIKFQAALDVYQVPPAERFIGMWPRSEVSITFANVTIVIVLRGKEKLSSSQEMNSKTDTE